jgi:hypothetical protein
MLSFLFEWSIPGSTGVKQCIFNPHHRIIIKDGTGKENVVRVCFMCDQYEVNNGAIHDIPSAWLPTIRSFFAKEGMPPSPDDY